MRLERLEISGFKSFPERAHLAFDRGVTAIVGPNGCGKSNVVDAITWVLGEQSVRSLRGERMEDVIFNGSDARRPTAAAEVRLRLTGVVTEAVRRAIERGTVVEPPTDGNGDGQPLQIELPAVDARDVEVARRLYRSGESEYLIDGDVVRLRDVQDLLMDAGIGVKGYAVIEQGKIGQILSAKPTERRQLIEEAAGVTKYKSRRRAAELKLEAAQQNLTRVDDIIFELEKQRNALKRQAAKARRYRKLREELRRWEKLLFARKFRVLTRAIEAAQARLAEARGREGAAAERVAAVQRTVDVVREQLARSEGDALAIRDDVHARQLEMERRQQQLAFDRQQVEALTHGAGQLEGEIEQLVGRREPARVELELRREAAARAESDRREADAALSAEEESYGRALRGIVALETEVESTRQRTIAGGTAVTALRNVIERAAEARERIVVVLGRLEAEAADLEIETGQVRDERDRAADALAAATVSMDEVRAAREGVDAELASCRAERESSVRDLREQERELAGLSARLRSLEELDAAREGYGEAARAILHDGAADLCHFGSVADYLEADRPYERAVEACLTEFLQAVIVRGPEDAARGLAALREHNLGRCAFLMIETGTADPVHDQAERPVSAIPLADVLRITGPHADTIRRAIGPAWIVEDLEAARCAAAATGTPVVTPTGEVFRTGRLVFGGGRAGARGILATKREIKELRERLDPEQRHLEAQTEALREIEQGIFSGEQRVAGLVADLHHHEKVALEHELRVTRATETLERLARKMELVANERRRSEDERRVLEARQDEARESAARLEREQKDLDDALSAAQGRLTEARAAATDLGRRVADAKARQATFSERAAAIGTEVLRLEETAADLEQRIRIRTDERQRNEHRRGELAAAIRETIRQLESDDREFAALQARARESEQLVASLQAEFAVQETTVREARVALDEIRAVVGQLDVARATAESDLAHLAASCVETVQASLDEVASEAGELEQAASAPPDVAVICPEDDIDAEDEEAPGVDTSSGAEVASPAEHEREAGGLATRAFTAEEAIAELRAKIDRLGPVNMMAIEQFDELETRFAFLTTQRKDLVDSIAATGEAIKRIDKTTRERFREAYAAINKYFEETFTTLFGGGRAGLVMLDEDDLLESGIDIIAQPPGKRLQNVQLLSGGEKALSAMALLFAMFRYRPSPFCLLDEIDAPLDDANIGRFLEMLRGMLDRTQFIVITHSRKTMEMADRLYGVTMEEPGVSMLISLKLN